MANTKLPKGKFLLEVIKQMGWTIPAAVNFLNSYTKLNKKSQRVKIQEPLVIPASVHDESVYLG